MRPALLLAVAALGAGCPVTDPRCSAGNCEAMMEGCRAEPSGTPNTAVCFRANLKPPDDLRQQLYAACAEACAAGGSGEVVGCVAGKKAACLDAGMDYSRRQAAIEACVPARDGGKLPDPACANACLAASKSCENACPVTSWDPCFSCVKTRGLNLQRCFARC